MTPPSEQSKKRGSLSAKVEAQVREQILSKQRVAGAVLRPEDIGRELGVSQTPAREALQTLKSEGFLTTKPGVGFVVAALTKQDIRDIFSAQALIAGEIASRAVDNSSEEQVNELEAIHFELLAAAKRRDWETVEERNHAFHRHITHMANSPKLAHILGIVSRYVPRSFYSSVGGWVEASAHDHEAITAAFREHANEKARVAMAEHMTNAGELLAETFAPGTDEAH